MPMILLAREGCRDGVFLSFFLLVAMQGRKPQLFWLQCSPDLSITALLPKLFCESRTTCWEMHRLLMTLFAPRAGPAEHCELRSAPLDINHRFHGGGVFAPSFPPSMQRPSFFPSNKKEGRRAFFCFLYRCRAMQCNFFTHTEKKVSPPCWSPDRV